MTRRRPSRALTLIGMLLLVLALPGPAAAQASAAPAQPSVICHAIAARLAAASGWLGDLGARLDAVCDTLDRGSPAGPTLGQLIGQKLVVRMGGTRPSAALLGRIRRGEIGGVVLLASNIRDRTQVRALTRRLQRAARAGGQPPLLIALDQEGGDVKRVPWAPPTRSVPSMGGTGDADVAYRQGRATGEALSALGINTDLAPVADIPRTSASFMYQQGRVFSFDAAVATRLAAAFARGLGDAGVLATMKHFPGIGLANRNTDHAADVIRASRAALATDLRPYRRAIVQDIPLIMLSNAAYAAYDPDAAAGWSHAVAVSLLRDELGFEGISITDSLDGTAHARGVSAGELAELATRAGTDMILLTGTERTTDRVFHRLLEEAEGGSFDRSQLTASWDRIQRVKGRL
jgi:beta-N-acetylhexosaminidase